MRRAVLGPHQEKCGSALGTRGRPRPLLPLAAQAAPEPPASGAPPAREGDTGRGEAPPRCFGDTGVGVSTALLPAATRSQGAERQASAPQLCPSPGSPARGAFGQGASPEGRGPQGGRGRQLAVGRVRGGQTPCRGRVCTPTTADPRPVCRPQAEWSSWAREEGCLLLVATRGRRAVALWPSPGPGPWMGGCGACPQG